MTSWTGYLNDSTGKWRMLLPTQRDGDQLGPDTPSTLEAMQAWQDKLSGFRG
jgi:hypothetical protein